ncbi:MAG: heavy-metal-associated domain-containing protein [Bacteroidia bacterium]|nr:heavy-metal-associated domain-containing protein [Bacteroidia bacterium]
MKKMKVIKYTVIILVSLVGISCGEKASNEGNKIVMEVVNGMSTSTFKVWGNCDMCKETIESSLKVDGISKVDWNVDSKMITVSFDSTKINLEQIQKNIAAVGYDNVSYKGDDIAYNELPDCCQYDRK